MRPWVLALLLAACDRGADPQAAPPADGVAFADPVRFERHPVAEIEKGATIIVLDGGKPPRAEMRYRAVVGSTATTRLQLDTQHAFASGDRGATPMPVGRIGVTYRMSVTVDSIDDQGNLQVTARALDLAIVPLDEAAKVILQHPAYRAPAEPPTARATMTPHGELLEVKEVSALGTQYANVRSYSVPFPAEPIGVGARWRVVQTHDPPSELIEETEWRLDGWDGHRARVSAKSSWRQANHSFRGPQGSVAFRIEGGATLKDATTLLDGLPLVEAATLEMDFRTPFEGASGQMHSLARGTLKAP